MAARVGARGAVLEGVDCSNWQRIVAWERVAGAGRVFALVKASEDADYRDPYFAVNWSATRSAGLTRGAYHFARPSRVDPAASVDLFAAEIAGVGGLLPGDLVALDLEDTDVAPGAELADWTVAWLEDAAARLGVAPILYSGVWFMEPHGLIGDARLAAYPLWLADYRATPPAPPAPWARVAIWQYSASGSVPGIDGAADCDRFLGTAGELAAIGYGGAAPPDLTVLQDRTWRLLEDVQAVAAGWRGIGWPSTAAGLEAAAEAAKSLVRSSKGEQ